MTPPSLVRSLPASGKARISRKVQALFLLVFFTGLIFVLFEGLYVVFILDIHNTLTELLVVLVGVLETIGAYYYSRRARASGQW